MEPNQNKNQQTVVHVFLSTLRIKKKSSHCIFERVLGVTGYLKIQILIDKCALKNGCLFHQFCDVYQYLCCCLTIFTPYVGWNTTGYESDPLPYYRWIRNCYYPIIILKLYSSPGHSTSGPMSWYHHLINKLYPRSYPPPRKSYIWDRRQHAPQWWPAAA